MKPGHIPQVSLQITGCGRFVSICSPTGALTVFQGAASTAQRPLDKT
jgi:hypothetical protein